MTASLVLSLAVAGRGLGLAYLGVDALMAIDADAVPRASAASLNRAFVLITLEISVVTALMFDAVPGSPVARGGAGTSLHGGTVGMHERMASTSNRILR